MERLKKISADTVFVVQILIAFILVFEKSISVPPLLQAFGRLHPLLLHLPIGLLLVTVIVIFTRRYFEGTSLNDLLSFLLHFTALTASFTTLMGLLLSLEGTFAADQLRAHKWTGVSLSFLCWFLLSVEDNIRVLRPLGAVGVILLIFTGHFGATLTHGEDFVLGPLESPEERIAHVITDSTTLFAATIGPILESKCFGCHNEKKAKGKLVLSSFESMMKGGKNGALWKPEDAAHSLIVKRLSLPLESKEHMPPKDKAQLTVDEVEFISLWIDAGADTRKKLNEVAEADTLKKLASFIIPRYQLPAGNQTLYTFEFAPPEKIQRLSTPNRTVFQIARNEPAVQADFYLRATYQKKYLEELTEIKQQLISLNLSNMPVEDVDLKVIANFGNLEVLNLNNTKVKGDGLKDLASLQNLRSLSLSGTDISGNTLKQLAACRNLKEVFIWNTAVTGGDVESLSKSFPDIRWDVGYVADKNEVLKLNVPLLKNGSRVLERDEKVILKHNLPGTTVRYSLDGKEPDSVKSPEYKDPIVIEGPARLKAKAFKSGWLSSDVAEYIVFKKGLKPSKTDLLTKPDDAYPGEGVVTLVDEQKGLPDFYRHPAWMAFKNNDMLVSFIFEEKPSVHTVTLSYAKNVYAMCMPPEEMQVWGGNDSINLKLLARVNPVQPKGYDATRIEGLSIDLPSTQFKYYKLVAKPLTKLPAFRKAKKEKAWLMVDEIFFN
jgi:uncharacterized membrane protein